MKRFLPILILISFLAKTALAGFIDNKTLWDNMSNLQKTGYVQGVFDLHTTLMTSDSQEMIALKKHTVQCVLSMKMTAQGMVDLVNTMYQNDISIWKHAPWFALLNGMTEMCGAP